VRLAAVDPRPRREMPSDVGLAMREPARRKSAKPACCERDSSRVTDGYSWRSADVRVETVLAVSPMGIVDRLAVTVT
jgi:hypothetical protein